ncbi:MAG: glycosyltransferase family 2 protein [Candidatus Eisenbacteria bacterium]|uniref:Glycosyltransferase family 2 protein n=1 Tax=Eiseniibacteriota bacterium TaxID=2212470 RepID=A0A956M4C3_UNCEI|nr:glycosyltransferase family 2 protein [Candidatus Eisenbacteria bacterium]
MRSAEVRMGLKLSVVIPVYNEKTTLLSLLEKVLASPYDKELLVVDDYSTDGTREILQKYSQPDVRIFYHEVNKGKGAAIRTAIRHATADVVLIQDADLEYDPGEYPKLIEPIELDLADVVYGSRFLGGPHRVLFYWHYLGNQFLTTVSNMMTNLNLSDMETCYKAFRREIIQEIPLRSNRFGFEPEVTAKIARRGVRVYETPISYHGRTYAEGKKIGWKDGLVALWTILRYAIAD